MDLTVKFFLTLYFSVASILFLYGVHAYLMTFLFARSRREPALGTPTVPDLPRVTVQLPIYNEYYVVRRLLTAAFTLDYPRDRLEIQVLDDSTDDTSDIVRRMVGEARAEGLNVHHVCRGSRAGFKAGALREGLRTSTGTLIAIFDADFVPPRDFLRRTIPYFEDPSIGMVQTRWGHLNEDYSVLTRGQAIALDGHFLIEQTARHRSGCFISFNGTAGVWRRSCIEDAGNWQEDTLTEDLDLSYRAQLRSWRFVFLPDVVCPAELPSELNALKRQQFRWAKGSAQTMRKILPILMRAPLPRRVKAQAFVHLTVHFVYPLMLLLCVCAVPLIGIPEKYPQYESFFRASTIFALAGFGHPILYACSQRVLHRTSWRRRLLYLPVIIAGSMGIAINNSRGIFEGMLGKRSDFERTPKYGLRSRSDHWRGKRYHVPFSALTLIELAFAAYVFWGIDRAIRAESYVTLPFLVLYGAGFLYFGSLSLFQTAFLRAPRLGVTSPLASALDPPAAGGRLASDTLHAE